MANFTREYPDLGATIETEEIRRNGSHVVNRFTVFNAEYLAKKGLFTGSYSRKPNNS